MQAESEANNSKRKIKEASKQSATESVSWLTTKP